MGFFSNYNAIGRINVLIKQLEPKLDYKQVSYNIPIQPTSNVLE